MWIATNKGFISVVTADPPRLPKAEKKRLKGEGRPLCIRARKAEHLAALFPGRKVYQWKARDYPARIFIGAETFAAFMAEQARSIDYSNFKSSVRDHELHDAYMGVWNVMHGYQYGRYRQKPWQRRLPDFDQPGWMIPGGYHDAATVRERDLNEERMDCYQFGTVETREVDEVCGLLGCTADNPCRDCINDALDAGIDRYGAFDDRDDEDARSHLRVPPR